METGAPNGAAKIARECRPASTSGQKGMPAGLDMETIKALAVLLGHCRHSPLHLFLRHVFDVCGHPPFVAADIANAPTAVAVELVGWFTNRCGARGNGALVNGVGIRHVQVEHGLHGLAGGPLAYP